ncbi:hypothetical protein EON63_16200 [archaeon]|nr:MAG: hypothetical protein EON63_16200 [archaeon]
MMKSVHAKRRLGEGRLRGETARDGEVSPWPWEMVGHNWTHIHNPVSDGDREASRGYGDVYGGIV